jgi:hypothetical protein
MYDELRQLAAERSSERRVELLRRLTDLFFDGIGAHTDTESYLFDQIMEKIVDQISHEAKVQVAGSLATLAEFPPNVMRKLANDDDIEIARPVLRGSPGLTDEDLVSIASRGSQAHLSAIATRSTLSEPVTDVLINRGDAGVVRTVSGNHDARFTAYGWNQLVDRASEDVDLQDLLVQRPDLAQESIDKLLPLISKALAIKLAERGFDVRGRISPDLIATTRRRFAAALRDRRTNIKQVEVLVALVRKQEITLDQAIVETTRSERLIDVAGLLSEFTPLERNYLFSLVARGQIQTQLVLFRSLNLAWPTVSAVLELRALKHRVPRDDSPDLQNDYQAIEPATAQRIVRFLQIRRAANAAEQLESEPSALSA